MTLHKASSIQRSRSLQERSRRGTTVGEARLSTNLCFTPPASLPKSAIRHPEKGLTQFYKGGYRARH